MQALFIFIFLGIALVVVGAATLAFRLLTAAEKRGLLHQLSGGESVGVPSAPSPGVFRERGPEAPSGRGFAPGRLFRALERRAAGADLDWTAGGILFTSALGAAAGALLGWFLPLLLLRSLTACVLGLVLGCLPFWVIGYRRAKRLRLFEEQFPDALDFMARSLRAGHAFNTSLEMIGAESPEPLGTEFRRLFRELNLGASLDSALTALAERIPLVDVKFFVSAVLLQREAGGNLSEILTNLAFAVRERFRLKGHIVSATAHARITATILSILPLVVLIGLQIRAPSYARTFVEDPDGPYLLIAAVAGQAVGYYLMRKLVNFRI
jgi:tight adherence protein B